MPDKRVDALNSLNKNDYNSKYITLSDNTKIGVDLITDLNNAEYSLSVRANNTISLLDDVTQDPNMPSYVRTQLWQAVSKLESIRE